METNTQKHGANLLPQAQQRPRSLVVGWLVGLLALAGTGFCLFAIGAGYLALQAPDGDGMEGIAVLFGAAYLIFFAPALGLAAAGIRTHRLVFTFAAAVLMGFAVVGSPVLLFNGL